jgi:hypothetical protein
MHTVELLEWCSADPGDLANGTVAVHFGFERAQLTVYNALDENGLAFQSPETSWRRHPLG